MYFFYKYLVVSFFLHHTSIFYKETFPGLIPGFNGTMLLVVGDVLSTVRRL